MEHEQLINAIELLLTYETEVSITLNKYNKRNGDIYTLVINECVSGITRLLIENGYSLMVSEYGVLVDKYSTK